MEKLVEQEILRTVAHEGGLSDHPADAGGLTKYGISQKSYPDLDIANLTLTDALRIYERDFYNRMACNHITSRRARWKLFDIGVNCGTTTAIKIMQRALGIDDDGIIGPETLRAANQDDEGDLVLAMAHEQAKHYARRVMRHPDQRVFLLGWVNRAFDMGVGL